MMETSEQRGAEAPPPNQQEHSSEAPTGVDESPPPTDPSPRKSPVREWIESLAFTVMFVLAFTRFVAQATQVPTESMKPAIMVGDHFFLDKLAFPANYPEIVHRYLPERSLERGDVVAFLAPAQGEIPFVKRLIGMPGDLIEIRDKKVRINEVELSEPYKIHVDTTIYRNELWTPNEFQIRDNYGPERVPDGSYFVMGDNRDNSNDSRYWGFITRPDIIGKPLFIYWSYAADPYIPGRRTMRERLKGYISIVGHFFTRTRWFRLGMMIE